MFGTFFRPSSDIFSELNRLQGVLDQVLQPSGAASIRSLSGATFPMLNVGTTPDAIEVMVLAPGLDPTSLELTVDRGLLTISGQRASRIPGRSAGGPGTQGGQQGARQQDQGQQRQQGQSQADEGVTVYAQERFAGSFRRVLSLPEDADPGKVDANYREGILRITISRRESTRPRRIEVS